MATIHATLQSKSVGKTYIASMLAHYLRDEREQNVLCVDADDICRSLSQFKVLKPEIVGIRDIGAYLHTIPEDTEHVVIDLNAGGYMTFCSSLVKTILPALRQDRHSLHIHTVVVGGSQAAATFNGFRSLAQNFGAIPITVWLNSFFGPVELEGVPFEESKVYRENIAGIHALIRMPEPSQLAMYDLNKMLIKHLTFQGGITEPTFFIATRSRIFRLWQETKGQLERAALCG